MNNNFHIVINGRNCKKYILPCILSCVNQNYDQDKFFVTYGDDHSDDGTYEFAKEFENKYSNFKVVQPPGRSYQNFNIDYQVRECSKPNSIILTVDADDWLFGTGVLNTLNKVYNSGDVWMTYGSYEEYPYRDVSNFYKPYSDVVIADGSFRKANWLASHLRTFKRELYLKIKQEDLKDEFGNPFKVTGDLAMMFPMLEMSGSRSRFIKEILYVYNTSNPSGDSKILGELQLKMDHYIRNKQPYKKLDEL
jgi:glycosyltransferase involved in cell wall biosynthesis